MIDQHFSSPDGTVDRTTFSIYLLYKKIIYMYILPANDEIAENPLLIMIGKMVCCTKKH